MVDASLFNWSNVPVERPETGIERQVIAGERFMVCRFKFAPFLVTPEHEHPHEQMSIVLRGRVRYFLNGIERLVGPGDVILIPPGCLHGATMMDEEVVLLDVFSPLREDFLK